MRLVRERAKINQTTIEAAWKRHAPKSRLVIADTECRGLALIVNATGMVWRFDYKPRGLDPATGKRFATRSITLGNPASLSPKDAREEARKKKGEALAGRDPAAEKKAAFAVPTVDALLNEWLAWCEKRVARADAETAARLAGGARIAKRGGKSDSGMSPLTLKGYREKVDAHLRRSFGRMKPEALTREAIIRWKDRATTGEGGTAATLRVLSAFCSWMVDRGHLRANPCARLGQSVTAEVGRPLSEDEIARLVAVLAEREARFPEHVAALRLMLLTGARVGEVLNLRWQDVDRPAGLLRVVKHKTARGAGVKHLIITPAIAAELDRAAAWKANEWVLPGTRGKAGPLGYGALKKKWEAWRAEAGLSAGGAPRLHDLRHTVGSIAANAGATPEMIQALLGHSQISTTRRYIKRDAIAEARSAAAKVAEIIQFPAVGKKPAA
ncbi:tyrosine-type recombinase/integrase [Neoroseomonas rubea]|uniref:tyrosine-type recombinase/integrase n=1 Tax=Neoroseomonas rubea TaxID=2748666 RepID=UPI001E32C314|nr:tyrosine-type recombinase/integrase [Roseomonas rubea]